MTDITKCGRCGNYWPTKKTSNVCDCVAIDSRKKDLFMFLALISECKQIDGGSHVIERLGRVIGAATELDAIDLTNARSSFSQYIINLVNEDIAKRAEL